MFEKTTAFSIRALKRTFVYMVFVAIISAVLYFTDGLWQCAAPYTLTPVDLSSLQKKAKAGIETCSLLFSAHISYGKGKYLNQTVFLQNLPRIIVYVI